MALAYFSVCLRRSLVTRASSEVSACVGDRLRAAYKGIDFINDAD